MRVYQFRHVGTDYCCYYCYYYCYFCCDGKPATPAAPTLRDDSSR